MSQEQRGQCSERRKKRTSPFSSLHGLRGRRRHFRRAADETNPDLALDWHSPHLLAVTLAILVLCLADAHNTLQLMSLGAEELNIFMDYLIQNSVSTFIQVKLGLTALGVVVLVAYQHIALFERIRIRHVLYTILAIYVALVSYELAIWPGPGVPFIFIPA